MQLFPPEIINSTTESHFARRSSKVWVVYLAVLLAVASAVAALPFVYVPVTAQARGVVRSPNENNPLQMAVTAEIITINLSENQQVRKGDTLVALNTGNIDEQINLHLQKIREDSTFVADINALLSGRGGLVTHKYLMERQYYDATVKSAQPNINYLLKEYEVSKTLWEKSAISKSDYLRDKNAYDLAVGQAANSREQFRNRWAAERSGYEIEITERYSAIRQAEEEKTKYALKAAESGTIIQFNGLQRGNFAVAGQTICYITSDSNLLVDCYVSPADIGYIAENQKVTFQLDAFNYNQWGLARGAVSEISRDVLSENEQAVFRVRCRLDNKYLQLKNGYQGNIKKGMTLTGRFYLTDRTLWQLLFDKVDNWLNPVNN